MLQKSLAEIESLYTQRCGYESFKYFDNTMGKGDDRRGVWKQVSLLEKSCSTAGPCLEFLISIHWIGLNYVYCLRSIPQIEVCHYLLSLRWPCQLESRDKSTLCSTSSCSLVESTPTLTIDVVNVFFSSGSVTTQRVEVPAVVCMPNRASRSWSGQGPPNILSLQGQAIGARLVWGGRIDWPSQFIA